MKPWRTGTASRPPCRLGFLTWGSTAPNANPRRVPSCRLRVTGGGKPPHCSTPPPRSDAQAAHQCTTPTTTPRCSPTTKGTTAATRPRRQPTPATVRVPRCGPSPQLPPPAPCHTAHRQKSCSQSSRAPRPRFRVTTHLHTVGPFVRHPQAGPAAQPALRGAVRSNPAHHHTPAPARSSLWPQCSGRMAYRLPSAARALRSGRGTAPESLVRVSGVVVTAGRRHVEPRPQQHTTRVLVSLSGLPVPPPPLAARLQVRKLPAASGPTLGFYAPARASGLRRRRTILLSAS